MAKIEVEQRGLLSPKRFTELQKFFSENGSLVNAKKRFSMIATNSKISTREVKDDLIDIKLRITNKKPELAVKYGKCSGKDSRREFNFFLDEDQYDDMLDLLQILGYNKYVIMANTKHDFLYRGIEFSLVEVPNWGHYFEAEISTEPEKAAASMKKIDQELLALDLKALDEEEFYDLLDDLNSREGCRVDLEKAQFSEIKKKFSQYF